LRQMEQRMDSTALQKAKDVSTVDTIKRRTKDLKDAGANACNAGMTQAAHAKAFAKRIASDRLVQVTAASAVGGGAVVGAGGAGAGLLTGGAVGAAVGILPALFTFGLSIPLGAVIGAGCGAAVGGAAGGTVGFTGAGAVGFGAYTKRAEIKSLTAAAHAKVKAALGNAKLRTTAFVTLTTKKTSDICTVVKNRVLECAAAGSERAVSTAKTTKAKMIEVVSDKGVQATAASAAGGGVVLGAGGAATGVAVGGAVGAAVGVVPAIFTFGLSIPFCAVLGGGCGLAVGAAAGGTAGVVAGAGGYQAYSRRETILTAVGKFTEKARSSARGLRSNRRGASGSTE